MGDRILPTRILHRFQVLARGRGAIDYSMRPRLAFLQSTSYQMVRFCTGPEGRKSKERIRTKVARRKKYYAEPNESSVLDQLSEISCHSIFNLYPMIKQ